MIFQFAYNKLPKERIPSILYAIPRSPSPLLFNLRIIDCLRNGLPRFYTLSYDPPRPTFHFAYNRLLKERIVSILYAIPRSPSPRFFNLRIRKLLKERIVSILYAILRSPSPQFFNSRIIDYLRNESPRFYTLSYNPPRLFFSICVQ